MMLVSGTLLAADGEALRIGIDNEAARRELSRKETLQRLRAIASEGAGRELRVEVGPLPSEHAAQRSEEHTSELQSPCNLVCRLLLEKKKKNRTNHSTTIMSETDP